MIMMRSLFVVALLGACACGGTEVESFRVSLRAHALPCANGIPGLQAELAIPDHTTCALVVAPDRTISGACPAITTGRIYEVRLAYFVQISEDARVDIARLYQTIDLTAPSDDAVAVSFPDSKLETNIDTDSDQLDNIVEVCSGRDPLVAGQ
jgi:hypothetical protein